MDEDRRGEERGERRLPAGGGVASVLHCPSLRLDSFDKISVQTFRLKIKYYFLLVKFTVCLVRPAPAQITEDWRAECRLP